MDKEGASPPSIRDLARALGLSKSTIHYALQNNPTISAETRQRVREEAKKMGYRSNPVVSALTHELRKGRQSHMRETLCYLITTDYFYAKGSVWEDFLKGAKQRAFELGYNVEVFHAGPRGKYALPKLKRVLKARGIRGILVAPLDNAALELDFAWENFASVTIGYRMKKPELHAVHCDHRHVMATALRELDQRGYRRIGMVVRSLDRLFDEKAMMAQLLLDQWEAGDGKVFLPPLITEGLVVPQDPPAYFAQWLKQEKPEAMIFIDTNVYGWLERLSVRVPEDLGALCLVSPHWEHLSGVENREFLVGSDAAQFLISNLALNEVGLPANPIAHLVQPRWQEGETLRAVRLSGAPACGTLGP